VCGPSGPDIAIGAGLAIADERGLDEASRWAALALDQIDRHPRLARGEEGAGAAAHGFDPLHRLIHLIKLGVFEEGQVAGGKEGTPSLWKVTYSASPPEG
jgi:hypothetical protein